MSRGLLVPSKADDALSFLALLPHARHNLVAIDPETERVTGITRDAGDADLGTFIEQNLGRRNIYFSVNEPRPGAPDSKLRKSDIAKIRAVFADLDAKEGPFEEMREMRRQQLAQLRGDANSDPTHAVDTGGGLGLFWLLAEPLDATSENVERVEAQGRGIASLLNGDTVQNVDRIMRLPGTINLPDAVKKARGRVAAPAVLLHFDGPIQTLEELAQFAPPQIRAPKTTAEETMSIDIGLMREFSSYAELPLDLRQRLMALEGEHPAFANAFAGRLDAVPMMKDKSGSGQIFALAGFLRAGGFTPDEFAQVAWVWPHGRPSGWDEGDDYKIQRDLQRSWAACAESLAVFSAKTKAADDFKPIAADEALKCSAPVITATPYDWPEASSIAPRQFLFDRHYIRSYASGTTAPGGVGKTSHSYVEALSMVTGRGLLGGSAPKRLRVWIWNGEDPIDEVKRRLSAIGLHYGLGREEIGDRLFVDTGQTAPIVVATKHGESVVVAEPLVASIIQRIRMNRIDVVIIDPFVSSHGVPENDNSSIDRVTKLWSRIAVETSCSVELIHHVRKSANGAQSEFTVDDARGGGAFINALRSARVINVMSKSEAEKAAVPLEERRSFFRIDNGKSNMQPPVEKATWRKLVSVALDNGTAEDPGDRVGVVTQWAMPDALEVLSAVEMDEIQREIETSDWAENSQSKDWAGHAIAKVLGIDAGDVAGKQQLKTLIRALLREGPLFVERVRDTRTGREKPLIRSGRKG